MGLNMLWLLVAALFLPLFPLSMVFNAVLGRLRTPWVRAAVLLLWPQIGIAALYWSGVTVPTAFLPWALGSAALYGLRLLTVLDLGTYAGFLASSALALTWGLAGIADPVGLALFAFWFSLPAALLVLLTGPLVRRFGAAYASICPGLGRSMPRLSAGLVLAVLAAIGTAPFPAFFALWTLARTLDLAGAVSVLVLWLTWGWSAALLVRGFVFGKPRDAAVADIGGAAWAVWVVLGVFAISGMVWSGGHL
ncbi:MAG TPA: hypothetical protein VFN52_06275 [Acidiferrobacteraceae bacterium]|nr:hypothetical protein [Acidiferrobacteraceae bacterium]